MNGVILYNSLTLKMFHNRRYQLFLSEHVGIILPLYHLGGFLIVTHFAHIVLIFSKSKAIYVSVCV